MGAPLAFVHHTVLIDEVVAAATACAPRTLLDCTLGGGGHAAALLAALPGAELLGLDRDPVALRAAGERLAPFGTRVRRLEMAFAPFAAAAAQAPAEPGRTRFDFVLADLGVSSPQLDEAARGFSFRHDAPLDMRMSPHGETAAELIARLSADELANVLYELGDERASRPIARALVAAQPTTTGELAAVVRQVKRRLGMKGQGTDLATQAFMALRMAVNDELGQLAGLLAALPGLVQPGGRFAIISFHSGEDRLVKRAIAPAQTACSCSPLARRCTCAPARAWRAVGRGPIVAGAEECRRNARARSAKLRVASLRDVSCLP